MVKILEDLETSAVNAIKSQEGDVSEHVSTLRVVERIQAHCREIADGSGLADPFITPPPLR